MISFKLAFTFSLSNLHASLPPATQSFPELYHGFIKFSFNPHATCNSTKSVISISIQSNPFHSIPICPRGTSVSSTAAQGLLADFAVPGYNKSLKVLLTVQQIGDYDFCSNASRPLWHSTFVTRPPNVIHYSYIYYSSFRQRQHRVRVAYEWKMIGMHSPSFLAHTHTHTRTHCSRRNS